jgi:hypothetical protein
VTILGNDLFSRYLRNHKSPWLKVSRRRFKKIVAYFKHGSLFCNFKKKREAPKIRENELPENSIEKIQNEGFHSCHNASLYSSSSPSMALQDSTKGINTQRRRRFHNTPLNLPEIDFQMPNIPIEIFSTFFGDASEDAEKHLINFKGTCYDFNLTEDNVTCRLFLQTLQEDALEWYSSLMPNSITSWDVLEDSFAENFIPKVHSYVFVDVLNVVSHPPSPTWTQKDEMNDSEEEYHETLQEFSESNLVVENEGKNSKDQEKDINISYTPYEEEIKESPPNMQEEFSQNKEELVEENNFENKEDSHCIEEEHCQDITNETIILNVEK